jgi:transcriptional/translational regulatory protein YebC/TACO1
MLAAAVAAVLPRRAAACGWSVARSAAAGAFVPRRMMAGHSKWAKIARSKGANDAKRGALFSKHASAIAQAARSGDALRLQTAIEKAQRDGTPKAIIERAKDTSNKGEAMEEILYEGIGPSSVAVLVEALTSSRNRAAKTIRATFNKFGGDFQSSGSVSWQFTTRGRFTLEYDAGAGAQDRVMEAALGADGVEDVEFVEEEHPDSANEGGGDEGTAAAAGPPGGGKALAYVYCDAGRLGSVRNALVAAGFTPSVSEVLRTPQSTVDVPEGEEAEAFAAFLERLEDNEDVQNVYHNAA